jgi:hypothetical protein
LIALWVEGGSITEAVFGKNLEFGLQKGFHHNLTNDHAPFAIFLGEHGHIYFLMEHGRFSNFSGAWSFFKFCWNMRIFLSKALGSGQSGPKIKSLPGG